MFKKTIQFDDLDGNPVEQTFYFHYDKKEVAELIEFGYISKFRPDDVSKCIPLEKQLKILRTPVEESGLSQQENTQNAYDIFQNLILDAYGKKGADNVTFVKNKETRAYWASHVAFPEMIFEFLNNPRVAAEFIENCLPPKFRQEAIEEMRKAGSKGTSLAEMVEEAERRQQDPATRIEPGMDAAIEAGVATPEMAQVAQNVAEAQEDGPVPVAPTEDRTMTEQDIMAMPDEEFKNLDVRNIPKDLLPVAFRRKMQS